MTFRITILCENSVGPISGALGEHGFSALIETGDGASLLFDTGQGATLLHNAHIMNKDLRRIRAVVLSHGHYDHCGGLLPLLRLCAPQRVAAHPDIFVPRYRNRDTGESVAIGIPHDRKSLEDAGAKFDLDTRFREIAPDVYLSGAIPRLVPFETGDRGLFRDASAREPDMTPDDQALILKSDKGLTLLLGCCHSGLINTLNHIDGQLGSQPVHAVIGGTHLGFCGKRQVEETIAALKTRKISRIAASHCTGFNASARLLERFPGIFTPAHVGYTMEI